VPAARSAWIVVGLVLAAPVVAVTVRSYAVRRDADPRLVRVCTRQGFP